MCIGRIQQPMYPVAGITTESWIATTTVGAPNDRWGHTAIWTGIEMIVWGGDNGSSPNNTGGRYTPGDYPLFTDTASEIYIYIFNKY